MSMIGNVSSFDPQRFQAIANALATNNYGVNDRVIENEKYQNQKSDNSLSTKVAISEEALKQLGLAKETENTENTTSASGISKLSSEELKQVEELISRDQEVRAHERAHMMVGGSLVRKGVSYQYQTGPDGQRYAVGGEVSIDSSAVNDDPSATIRKMQQVKRAALAPAEPSSQDRAVAAAAAQTEAAARQELMQQTSEETETA